ncbi:hypothetical protein OQA88_8144 [Cercophora sp. LCS_1]
MPPKRPSTGATGTKKKSKSPSGTSDAPEGAVPPRNPRWAPISGSGNADVSLKIITQNPVEAYRFILMCEPPFDDDEDDEEDEEEEEDEDKKSACDNGKTCLCRKPAPEHPEHPWKITDAGQQRLLTQHTYCNLRDPDTFDMYTFNDHAAYGVIEVLQNLLLDFEEAAGNYKEQWTVCEALAYFLPHGRAGMMTMADDGDLVDATVQLIGRLFLSMLAQLERDNLLAKDSEIQNLDVVMALFIKITEGFGESGLLEESKAESIGPAKDKRKWFPHQYPNQILAYAQKYDIKLVGPSDLEDVAAKFDADAPLPKPESNTGKADPFNFAKALKAYKTRHGGVMAFLSKRSKAGTTPIGGDALDLTSWTSKERAAYAFNKKDPLGKKELDALKRGDVMC